MFALRPGQAICRHRLSSTRHVGRSLGPFQKINATHIWHSEQEHTVYDHPFFGHLIYDNPLNKSLSHSIHCACPHRSTSACNPLDLFSCLTRLIFENLATRPTSSESSRACDCRRKVIVPDSFTNAHLLKWAHWNPFWNFRFISCRLAGSLGPLRQQGAKMCYSVLIQISQKVFFTPGIKISHKYLRHVQDLRGRCGCTSNLRGPFLTHAPTSSASSFPNAL